MGNASGLTYSRYMSEYSRHIDLVVRYMEYSRNMSEYPISTDSRCFPPLLLLPLPSFRWEDAATSCARPGRWSWLSGAAGQESAWLFGQHSLWQTLGRAGSRQTQGRALHQLGQPVTAMGRPVVCIASGLLLKTIGNGGLI